MSLHLPSILSQLLTYTRPDIDLQLIETFNMGHSDRHLSERVDPSVLGEPIRLPVSGLIAKSHFLKASMSERLSSWDQHNLEKRGIPSDQLIRVYEEWGKGGFGLILSGYRTSQLYQFVAYALNPCTPQRGMR